MKRLLTGLFIGVIIGLLLTASVAFAGQPITLIVNGQAVQCDVPPQIINGRTMVPISAVAKALGCQVSWDGSAQAVNITSSTGAAAGTSGLEYYFPRPVNSRTCS